MPKKTASVLSMLIPLTAALVATKSWAGCGQGTPTITNLPTADGSFFQVNALGSGGQLTGYFMTPSQGPHAFIYSSGNVLDLGTLGGSISEAFAINASGQVAGDSSTPGDAEFHALSSQGTNLVDLGTLGGVFSTTAGINDKGDVIGFSLTIDNAELHAFLARNGTNTDLGTFGGGASFPYALNNAGVVVGESTTTNGDTHAYVYTNGVMVDLGTLGGNYSSAFAINNSGLIVGESSVINGDTHAFIYASGVMTDVGTFGGNFSSASAINQAGQVIGDASDTNGSTRGFLYSAGVLTDLGTFGGASSFANSLNNLGQVVGSANTSTGDSHAFLWQNGTLTDLNSLVAGSAWVLNNARYINDAGRIIGDGVYNGLDQTFILDLASANHPPTAIAGVDQTVQCDSQVSLDGSLSTDPDGDALAYQWSSGGYILGTNATLNGFFVLGTNVVTLLVTDPCGATAQASLTVTVIDSTAPKVTCGGDVTVAADSNCQASVPNVLSSASVSDNCTAADALILTQSPAAGTLVGLGPHTVTLTAKDLSGNTGSCSLLFTVLDKTAPSILSLPTLAPLSADSGCQATVPNILSQVIASDSCTASGALVLSQSPAAGTPLALGQHTLTITVRDAAGNSSTGSVSVAVVDTAAPSFVSMPGPLTVSVGSDSQGIVPSVLGSVVVSDACTPRAQLTVTQSPAPGTVLPKGQYTITVTATDLAGNSSAATVGLSLVDTTAPVIETVTVNPNVLSSPNHQIVPVTVSISAHDNCDAALVSNIISITANQSTDPGDIEITGDLTANLASSRSPSGGARVYTITVRCSDSSGNSSLGTVTVTVPQGNK